ncbi:MAG: 3-phosphoserine/phosphohydroxythreonine transaminase [Bacteroidia bacterium]|nr:3-phosphoserine/phosphohydroxythreonine transaminase [Bacteroidia bacterium]
MNKQKVYNFSAGPAVLPKEVLEHAQAELLDYQGRGISVMEMSHRSADFIDILDRAEESLRKLMGIGEEYYVLFLQGGASSQFSMVPLNLFRHSKKADILDTGNWSKKAIGEARRYGEVRVVASSADQNYNYIPAIEDLNFDSEADYIHITTNNTIFGTCMPSIPDTGNVPLVADMSSDILSRAYKVDDFGLIYAGAQKNIGPAGLTLVIVRKELVGKEMEQTPLMLKYSTHAAKKSAYNTPPCFSIYMAGLVFDWTIRQGGVAEMEKRNRKKAQMLYDFLDESAFFDANVKGRDRSLMNVPFRSRNAEMDAKFIAEADKVGLKTLKGYRTLGGMRASIYNPMPLAGVEELVNFMKAFEKRNA